MFVSNLPRGKRDDKQISSGTGGVERGRNICSAGFALAARIYLAKNAAREGGGGGGGGGRVFAVPVESQPIPEKCIAPRRKS